MYATKLIAPPTQPAVTLQQVKNHLRVLHTHEDSLIEVYRAAAIDHVQDYTGLQLGLATYELSFDADLIKHERDVYHRIELAKPPFREIVSVKYTDESGVEQDYDSEGFFVFTESSEVPGVLSFKRHLLPAYLPGPESVRVRYKCGYVSTDDIPNAFVVAILLLIQHWYINRSAVGQNNYEIPFGVEALLGTKRLMSV